MTTLLEVKDLRIVYGGSGRWSLSRTPPHVAVNGVSFNVAAGETLGIVGESGCGKTSVAKALLGLTRPQQGQILFRGRPLTHRRDPATRREIQMVFQDPGASLNPSMTVRAMLTELLVHHRLRPRAAVSERCRELISLVGLPEEVLDVRPRRLSGGQKQRVAIARALALEPSLIVADEAVAALDVSVQATVLNLLRDLQEELEFGLIFISHDLAVVRHLCRRVVVMCLGEIVEDAPADRLFDHPEHEYTKKLLAAAPRLHNPSPRSSE